jgi:hypothetical protein
VTNPKTLDTCGHTFCTECVDTWLRHKRECPECGLPLDGVKLGDQPADGTMAMVYTGGESLPGHDDTGLYTITYIFPAGRQGVSTHN